MRTAASNYLSTFLACINYNPTKYIFSNKKESISRSDYRIKRSIFKSYFIKLSKKNKASHINSRRYDEKEKMAIITIPERNNEFARSGNESIIKLSQI